MAVLNAGSAKVSKWLFATGLGIVVSFAGCKKAEVSDQAPEAPSVAATPVPPPPPPVAPIAEATPAPELAPPGVFYLIAAVSIETTDGILGLKPGQPLRQIRPGVYQAGTNEVSLRPDQVTNDMALARRLMTQDQRVQAALRQRLAAQAPPAPATAPGAVSPPPAPGALALDEKTAARNELIRQRQVLNVESQQVAVSLNAFSRYGPWDVAARKSPQAFQLLQQFNNLRKQQMDIDAKLAQFQ